MERPPSLAPTAIHNQHFTTTMDKSWLSFPPPPGSNPAALPRSNVLRGLNARSSKPSGNSSPRLDALAAALGDQVSLILSGSLPIHKVPILKLHVSVKGLCVQGYGLTLYLMLSDVFADFFANDQTVNGLLNCIRDTHLRSPSASSITQSTDLAKLFDAFNQESLNRCCHVLVLFLQLFNHIFKRATVVYLILVHLDRNILVNSNSKLTVIEQVNALFFEKLFSQDTGKVILGNLNLLLQFNRLYQLNKLLVSENVLPVLIASPISIADIPPVPSSPFSSAPHAVELDKILLNCLIIFKRLDIIVANLSFYRNLKPDLSSVFQHKPVLSFNRRHFNGLNVFSNYITALLLAVSSQTKSTPDITVTRFMSIYEKIIQHELFLMKLVYNDKDTRQELKVISQDASEPIAVANTKTDDFYFQNLNQYFQYSLFAFHANFETDNNKRFISLVHKLLLYKLVINNGATLSTVLAHLVNESQYDELRKLYQFHKDFDRNNVQLDDESLSVIEDSLATTVATDEDIEMHEDENKKGESNDDDDDDYDYDNDNDDEDEDDKDDKEEYDSEDESEMEGTPAKQFPSAIKSLSIVWHNAIYNQLFMTFVAHKKKITKREKEKSATSVTDPTFMSSPFTFEIQENTTSIIEALYLAKTKYSQVINNSFSDMIFKKRLNQAFAKIFNINHRELIVELVKYCSTQLNTLCSNYITMSEKLNIPFIQLVNDNLQTHLFPQFKVIYWLFLRFCRKDYEFFVSYYRSYLSRRLLHINTLLDDRNLHKRLMLEKVFMILFTKDFAASYSDSIYRVAGITDEDIYVLYLSWKRMLERNGSTSNAIGFAGDDEKLNLSDILEPWKRNTFSNEDDFSTDEFNDNANGSANDRSHEEENYDSDENNDEEASLNVEEFLEKFHDVYMMISDIELSKVYEIEFAKNVAKVPGDKTLFSPIILNKKIWPNANNSNYDMRFPCLGGEAPEGQGPTMLELFDAFNEMFFHQSNKFLSSDTESSSGSSGIQVDEGYAEKNKIFVKNSYKLLNWNFAFHYLILDYHLPQDDGTSNPVTIETVFIVGCILLLFNDDEELTYSDMIAKLKLHRAKYSSEQEGASNASSATVLAGMKGVQKYNEFENNIINSDIVAEKLKFLGKWETSTSMPDTRRMLRKRPSRAARPGTSIAKKEDEGGNGDSVMADSSAASSVCEDPYDLLKRSLYALQKSGLLVKVGGAESSTVSSKISLRDSFRVNESFSLEGGGSVLKILLTSRKVVRLSSRAI